VKSNDLHPVSPAVHAPAAPAGSLSDWPFFAALAILSGAYVLLIVGMLAADLSFTTPHHLLGALASPEIRYSIRLSLLSCTLTTLLSLWVAVPTGYLMSRHEFPGKRFMDAILDIPIVLPPLVIGLSLLILFQTPLGRALQRWVPVTYAVPSVILAQFAVACAFAVRTMLVTFDQISPRCEQVALTLGCNRSQAFWRVALPEARRGVLTAGTLAWARALGEFGPILIFSGATRLRTEVLPTTVFLELSIGNIEAAVAVSLVMIVAALAVLSLARSFGLRAPLERVL
jgi:molybdate transport system permease protein